MDPVELSYPEVIIRDPSQAYFAVGPSQSTPYCTDHWGSSYVMKCATDAVVRVRSGYRIESIVYRYKSGTEGPVIEDVEEAPEDCRYAFDFTENQILGSSYGYPLYREHVYEDVWEESESGEEHPSGVVSYLGWIGAESVEVVTAAEGSAATGRPLYDSGSGSLVCSDTASGFLMFR